MVGNTTMSIYWFFTSNLNSPNPSIFLNLTYPLRKNISFPKCLEITQKFTQNRKTMVNQISIWIWRCLKRERDIGRKALSSAGQTAFTYTPALSRWNRKLFNVFHVYVLVHWIWLSNQLGTVLSRQHLSQSIAVETKSVGLVTSKESVQEPTIRPEWRSKCLKVGYRLLHAGIK